MMVDSSNKRNHIVDDALELQGIIYNSLPFILMSSYK